MVKREYESSATSTKHWTGFLQRIKSPRTQPAYPPLFAVLPSRRFSRGLYTRFRSPLCFDGRLARRRVGVRRNKRYDRAAQRAGCLAQEDAMFSTRLKLALGVFFLFSVS